MTVIDTRPAVAGHHTCPSRLPWCTEHRVDDEGDHYHRTGEVEVTALNLYGEEIHALSVQGERLDYGNGTQSQAVWIHYHGLALELRPEDAVAFGRAVAAAGAVAADDEYVVTGPPVVRSNGAEPGDDLDEYRRWMAAKNDTNGKDSAR